jgi:N-acyl-D-amino-acid deacylase
VLLAILEQRGIVGAGLAVMVRGRLVHTRGFGWADRDAARPVGPATIFRMFSISKTVTATAILRARDQGLLRLQDSAYVIRSDATTLPGMTEDPRMLGVRIEHLLWFSSGLLYSYADPSLDCWRGGTLGREGHLRCARGLPLAFDPGSRQEYTNDGALILGRVLERVTGLAYDDYVRREIFEPVGVREIRLQEARLSDRPANETRVYPTDWAADFGTRLAIEQFDATGSWNSSPSELLRYLRGVTGAQGHPSLLSATSRALLETGPPFKAPAEPGWLGPLGWPARESSGYRLSGIGGGDGGCMLYSHAPEGVSYVAAFNTTGQDCWELERIIGPYIFAVASWPAHDLFRQP